MAAAHLDHGHIYGQCNGLVEAGARINWVFDPVPERVEAFLKKFPDARTAQSFQENLTDPEVQLAAAAAVPNERGPLGCRVMEAGKDYLTDKTPFTTLDQLEQARRTCEATGKKYAVYYCERIHVECAVRAGQLVATGAIGKVVQTLGTGPHRLNAPSRPSWFFEKEKYGGILCDIGSYQCEQFLFFTGAKNAWVVHATVGNVANPSYPELEDFGECRSLGDNGTSGYFRVDWLTPAGLGTWGDGRLHRVAEIHRHHDIKRSRSVSPRGLQRRAPHPVCGKCGIPVFW
jgi:predicted dehydrogenase